MLFNQLVALPGDGAVETSSGCSNGFSERDRLVGSVDPSSGPAVQLTVIPEMNFTCNGTITGYTFAGQMDRGQQNPMIQIWRQNFSQPDEYYQTGADIVINEVFCKGGFTEVFARVFHCNLTETAQREVQPGDILGLELAPQREGTIDIASARVVKGPTNYVFSEEQLSSVKVVLSESDSVNQGLPQITFNVSGMLKPVTAYLMFTDTTVNESFREWVYQRFSQYSGIWCGNYCSKFICSVSTHPRHELHLQSDNSSLHCRCN